MIAVFQGFSSFMWNYFNEEKKWLCAPLRKRWRIQLREKCCVIALGPCCQAKGVMGRVRSFLLSLWHCVCLQVLPRAMHRPADSVISIPSETLRPPHGFSVNPLLTPSCLLKLCADIATQCASCLKRGQVCLLWCSCNEHNLKIYINAVTVCAWINVLILPLWAGWVNLTWLVTFEFNTMTITSRGQVLYLYFTNLINL